MGTTFRLNFWIKISLLNLSIVALLGVLMRYKIGFEFPFFDQKNIQHAHSHFAFAGWISQIIMAYMINVLQQKITAPRLKTYQNLLIANCIFAFGMLIAFSTQGYAFFSILCSVCSILISFAFSGLYIVDLNKTKQIVAKRWFILALIFNILSSLGTFALVYMMATKKIPQHAYLASVYFYLHFQYNGWFFFACIGLLFNYMAIRFENSSVPQSVYWLFALSCIPAYGLSILWLNIPTSVYIGIAFAAIAQFIGWLILLAYAWRAYNKHQTELHWLIKLLFIAFALSLTIKLSLQLGTLVPSISKLAFGFRPVVIAYLHLVFLAVTSVFLFLYGFAQDLILKTKWSIVGMLVFLIGIFANELLLGIQGIASFSYIMVPNINIMLFAVAVWMFIGIGTLTASVFFESNTKAKL
jgi:hypothetical protein